MAHIILDKKTILALCVWLLCQLGLAQAAVVSSAPGYGVSSFIDLAATPVGEFKAIAFDASDNFYAAERTKNNPDIYQFTSASNYTSSSTSTHSNVLAGNTRVSGLAFVGNDLWVGESVNASSMSLPVDQGYLRGPSGEAIFTGFRPTDIGYNSVNGRIYFTRKDRTTSTVTDIVSIDPLSLVGSVMDPAVTVEFANLSGSAITVDGNGAVFLADLGDVFQVNKTGPNPADFSLSLLARFDHSVDALAVDSAGILYALESNRDAGVFEVFAISQVPVPPAIWLFASSLLGLMVWAKKRKAIQS